ncbi:hypothetical protein WBP06_03105 [Novosphingobium sp. BL-8H]|uniref:hypothetical protein n=1 Tax=Novosphingobium sp. BL-8H TaxID=3127640 RepID=UPI003757C303
MMKKVISIPVWDPVREWRDSHDLTRLEDEVKRLDLIVRVEEVENLRGICSGALVVITKSLAASAKTQGLLLANTEALKLRPTMCTNQHTRSHLNCVVTELIIFLGSSLIALIAMMFCAIVRPRPEGTTTTCPYYLTRTGSAGPGYFLVTEINEFLL